MGRYRGTGTVVQSAYGIKPYTAFFGALKVRDTVDVEVEATIPAPGDDRPETLPAGWRRNGAEEVTPRR